MRALPILGALLCVALMTAPATLAVHGSPYVAKGLAVRGTEVYDATVEWTGWWTRSYVVTLTNTVTGDVAVDQHRFLGQEILLGGACCGGELFIYRGLSIDPTVDFEIGGIQHIFFQQGYPQHMLYTGTYYDYVLTLYVNG
jgi:hypothetical protein